ncbi:MAG TPA: PKD domain-containing protein, partial [Flavobacteriales bacterium]|nr:PKD domain-containing protein [Flavobacteriales bacterium]
MKRILFLLFFLTIGFSESVFSQCTNSSQWGSATAPTVVGTSATMSFCNYQTEYSVANSIVAGNTYSINYSLGGCVTIHSGTFNGPVVAFGPPPLSFVAPSSGTFYIHYNTSCAGCGTATNCGTSTITLTATGGGGGGGPANDNPCGATSLPVNTSCTNSSVSIPGNATATTGPPAPTCGNYAGMDVWYSLVVPANGSVQIQTTAGTLTDVAMALYNATSCSGPFTQIACSDDFSGLMPGGTYTGLTPGSTVYIRLWDYGGNQTGNFNICAISASGGAGGCNSAGGNNACASADPFCTGTAYNYCNSTGIPSAGTYDCLFSTPNPMWMYLNVQTTGSIQIQMQQFTNAGVPIDVDFALWGPFTSVANACANITGATPTVDCSYSIAATETATIPSAVAGQFYMLLITNYNGSAGYIQFSQTGGAGATNCSIVAPCSLTAQMTPPTCNGGTNGTITANVVGGSPNFTYQLVNSVGTIIATQGPTASTTATFTNLPAGNYTVNLTAQGPCTNSFPITITQPAAIAGTVTPANILCNGATTGSLNVTASGGTPGYNVSWTGTSAGNPAGTEIPAAGGSYVIGSLGSGTYTVTITDANNCTTTMPVASVTQPAILNASATPAAVVCSGGNTGSINVTSSGGVAGYNVSWTGPSTGNPAGTEIAASGGSYNITGLVAGVYTVTVTDNNGCTRTISSTVNPGVVIDANITPVAAQCLTGNLFNFSGSTSTISSGSITSYSWNFGNGNNGTGVNASQSYATAGTYTVTLTVSNGVCTNTETLNITVNPNPTATLTVTPPLCNGNNGTITVNPSGGSSFVYAWNPPAGQSTQTISVPAGGPYQVTVTNNFGCTATVSASMTQPTAITANGTPTAVSCNGGTNGSILVTASGGTPGYNVSWTGPAAGNPAGVEIAASGGNYNITGLAQGTYTVTITDANNCTRTVSATVTQPTAIAAVVPTSPVSCNGGSNGSINVTASGGTAAYNVSWTGPSSGNPAGTEIAASGGSYPITGLVAGVYTVTITDANGCTRTASATVTQPTVVTLGLASQTNVLCNGASTGSATVTGAGGSAPYTYSWS